MAPNTPNLVPPPSRYLITGYPSLAAFIASDLDRTAGIYKRFDRLAARNLLYLQSELADLQAELDALDEKDKADRASKQYARNWHDFKKKAEQEPARLHLVKEIRSTLKEYRENQSDTHYHYSSNSDQVYQEMLYSPRRSWLLCRFQMRRP